MAVIELVDRDPAAKGQDSGPVPTTEDEPPGGGRGLTFAEGRQRGAAAARGGAAALHDRAR